jgi:hypothetical protein
MKDREENHAGVVLTWIDILSISLTLLMIFARLKISFFFHFIISKNVKTTLKQHFLNFFEHHGAENLKFVF